MKKELNGKRPKPQSKPRQKESNFLKGVDFTKGKVLYDNVLVTPLRDEGDGIVLRPQQYEDKPEWGVVVVAGAGRLLDNGEVVPLKVKKGDTVLFQKYSAQKIRLKGVDYLLIREEDIHFVA